MPEQNPYRVLNIPQDATIEEIEDAYDAMFDASEPQAQAGDDAAIQFLHNLNTARETLLDPRSRAAVDAEMARPIEEAVPVSGSATRSMKAETQPGAATRAATGQAAPKIAAGRGSTRLQGSAAMKVRPRSSNRPRAVEPVKDTRRVPVLIASVLLLILVAGAATYLLLRPKDNGFTVAPADPTRGEVLAAVNGVPIYHDDWQARLDIDKNNALSDPLFKPFVNDFQGITGTRMLDILSYDSMDKLINLEVIQQQAKKEGLYPTPAQQEGLINDAKQQDLKNGGTFEQFLKDKNITADRYNRTVIQNVVYTVMANEHLPKTGTAQARTDGFIKWICDTRPAYDVKIYHKFQVAENKPCTSGLPTDLSLPGLPAEGEGTAIPGDVPTAVAPVAP